MKKVLFSIVFILAILSSMFSVNAFASEMTDGTYEVKIALWHSEDDKESMAADAIGKKATIVVENGVKTMHITSGEMSMMGIKASLQELRIADTKGNYTNAKVEVIDSEGNPTGFYFTMPHTNEYITVKVNPHLAIMGNKDIGARIKVDYSTLKLVKPAETATEIKTETTLIQTTDVSGKSVTETVVVTENVITDNPKDITTENTTAVTIDDATTNVQTDSHKSNGSYIIIAVVVAVIIIVVAVKIKRKK